MSRNADYSTWDSDDAPRAKPRKRPKRSRDEVLAEIVELGDTVEGAFNPSFSSSRHERAWILTYLGPFYEDHLIADVLRQVKGGKEATVYCCRAHPSTGLDLVAAKVYRPRIFRTLRNDAVYRAGGAVRDEQGKAQRDRRTALAMQKKTGFGQEVLHTAWLANEYGTMQTLHAAGADIPRPLAQSDNVILMEYLGEAGTPAPALHAVTLPSAEARPLFERLLWNVELMLAHDLVHADLSAHNILYWAERAWIIDFPQAVNAFRNPHAQALFTRDVERVCQYFARCGVRADAAGLARDLWRRYMLAEGYELQAAGE